MKCIQIQIQFYWTCSQKAKNQKAKQTIMHGTTIQDKKWNATQCDDKNKQSDIGLRGRDG